MPIRSGAMQRPSGCRCGNLGTQRLQGWTHSHLVPVVPTLRRHDRLHERDSLHSLAVAIGGGATVGQLVGVAHADQVGGDAAA
jgi:hypothetical protein